MATFLFTDIESLKAVVGGGANMSLELSSIEPGLYAAFHNHLKPWLGTAFFNEIATALEEDSLSTEQTALLPYLRRPLGMLGLHEYTKIGGIQFSEGGLFRMEAENYKTAYKYQVTDLKRFYLYNGYEALEHLLTYLEDNESDFSTWAASAGYIRNKALLINSAEDFRKHYSNDINRYSFEYLRSLLEDIDAFAIHPLLGDEQYEELKANILAKNLSAKEQQLVYYLQRAVANFAIKEALRRQWIRLEGRTLVSNEILEPQGYEREGSPTGVQISLAYMRQDEWANRNLSYATKYLADNLSDFPLYSAYLDAQAEEEAEENQPSSDYPERCNTCNCYKLDCLCDTSRASPTGIIGF
ncbi:MAG: hypothetical protein KDD28_27065 [Phaeodactylibacter sp.]|nr:hypothetical protein [Phaeodactylibacter sp.]